jgi:Chlorite dismutase
MTADNENNELDLREKGRSKDGAQVYSDRRLMTQFMAFGGAGDTGPLKDALVSAPFDSVLYADINDPYGVGLLTFSEDPGFFVSTLRDFLNRPPFSELTPKPDLTMIGRTYSLGYEPDLQRTLIDGPKEKLLDPDLGWAIWYPLRRDKSFEALSEDERRAVLGEHGKLGFKFGQAGYAKDIRLACHGLDKNDNDFVIGVLGKELYSLSILIQTMRKTKQTSQHLESLGPFFVGKTIYQSSIK